MNIRDLFADANTNFVLLLLVSLPLVQYLTGVLRAIANSTFAFDKLDIFIRTDIAGRVAPLTILIVLGRVIDVGAPKTLTVPGLDLGLLTGSGIALAVVYIATVIKAIYDNVNPTRADALPTTNE